MPSRSFFLLFYLLSGSLKSNGLYAGTVPSLWVERFSLEQGLSQTTVQAIAQDRHGFLWFGTADGLNRYDGYQFKIYRTERNDPCSLSFNNVYVLFLDRDGFMWLGARNGSLSRYDESTGCFIPSQLGGVEKAQWIFSLAEDEEGGLWAGSDKGLHHLPRDRRPNGHFTAYPYRPTEEQGLPHTLTTAILPAKNGKLWVGTYGGLSLFNPVSKTCRTWSTNGNIGLPSNKVWKILRDATGLLWIGTRGGLTRFDPVREVFLPITEHEFLGQSPIWDLAEGQEGRIWVGSADGLFLYLPETNEYIHYKHHAPDVHSLSEDTVTSLFLDKTNILWVGTYDNGLNKYNSRREMFNHIRTLPGSGDSFRVSINSIMEDTDGRLWAGAIGQGIYQLDLARNRSQVYRSDMGNNNTNLAMCLFEDSKKRIWAGSDGQGISLYHPETDRFVQYSALSGQRIFQILETHNGDFWLGSRDGLLSWEVETNNTQLHNFGDQVLSLYELADHRICVGTLSQGFYVYDPVTNQRVHYKHDSQNPQSLSHNRVNVFFEDPAGALWVGTYGGGLNKLDLKSGSSTLYGRPEGLPNEVIYSILSDESGHLWMSTNMGVSRFNPKTGVFKNFNFLDGLQSNEFNMGSFCKTRSGALALGGVNGLNVFKPNQIIADATVPNVVINELYLYNQVQSPSAENSPLHSPMVTADRVVFNYPDDVITFEFAALHYVNPGNNRYAYKMEGLDKTWVYTNASKRFATYTNPPAGDYVFRVKGSNQDGVWNEEGAGVKVKVHPPPWWSPLAMVLYCIGFVGIIWFFVRGQRQKLTHERELNERLEGEVLSRTRQLALKNATLEDQFREMEALEEIARAINNETGLDDVIRVVLEQGQNIITDADNGFFLAYEDDRSQYHVTAISGTGLGQDQLGIVLPRQQLLERYISRFQVLEEGISLANSFHEMIVDDSLSKLVIPKALLCLVLGRPAQGVLAFGSLENPNAFNNLDTQTLVRFKEHAENAFGRARELEELVRTQQELTESAHAAGMAENAENVLHNIGNILNSVRISGHLIEEVLGDKRWLGYLKKVVAFLDGYGGDLAEVAREERARHLFPMLQRTALELENQFSTGHLEGKRLLEQVQNVVTVLSEQREHVGLSDALLESVDLNELVHNVLKREMRTIKEMNMSVEYDFQGAFHIRIDRTKIIRVIYFLFKNACKALSLQHQGQRGFLRISTKMDGHMVCLGFEDNGIGMSQDQVNNVFAARTGGAEKVKSYGLHYCANIMRQMNGTIEISSPGPGKGAAAMLKFPVL